MNALIFGVGWSLASLILLGSVASKEEPRTALVRLRDMAGMAALLSGVFVAATGLLTGMRQ